MANVIEGTVDARGMKIGVIVSRFNNFVTAKLLEGALEGLKTHGGADDDLTVVHVPGAFEIPIVAAQMAASGKFDALVCLGAVIRGDTPHFEYVCDAVTQWSQQGRLGIPNADQFRRPDNRQRATGNGTLRSEGCKQRI